MESHSLITLHTLHEEMPEATWQTFKGIHIFLTVLSLIINCISLVVIYGLVSKLTRSLQLLSSLAFANMLAPWAVITTYLPHTSCQEEIHTGLLLTSHNATALTLLTYSLTLHIATFKPLQFEAIVTTKKVWITISLIWILSIIPGHLNFIISLSSHNHEDEFCSQVYRNTYISLIVSGVICGVTVLTCCYSFARILVYLRPIEALNRHNNDRLPRKSTHGVTTAIILVAFYFIVWPPYLISTFEHSKVHNMKKGHTAVITMFITMTLVLLNCACNPIIYGLRMESIRTGYSRMLHKFRHWLSNGWSRIKNSTERDDQPSSLLNPIESIC